MTPTPFAGRLAVVTGGTGGIGAASALALREAGADVVAIGRSAAKADALLARAEGSTGPGSLRVLVRDLAEMATVTATVADLAGSTGRIDLLLHAVGVLLTRRAHTAEGIELDLAVSYLSRFVFLEEAARRGLLHPGTRLVNIAASARRVPRYARMEFSSLEEVAARVGMRSHGQAQLANDLLTAQAPARYGITAIGYGPGAVDTDIRREVPRLARAVLAPFYARATRKPAAVARDVLAAFADPDVPAGSATFRDRRGPFPASGYVADPARQADLLAVSLALADRALTSDR